MNRKLFFLFALLSILSLLLDQTPTLGQISQPPEPPKHPYPFEEPYQPEYPFGAQTGPGGLLYMPERVLQIKPANQSPTATGGPDEYGYTWDDSVALNWIDGTTETGLSGSGDYVGPISLGFSFNYYENIYTDLFITSSGYISFDSQDLWDQQAPIPNPTTPNNVIAPYWSPQDVNSTTSTGHVYYRSGGTTPNRWFAVEWDHVNGAQPEGGDEIFTYEVILYENGDIRFQYLDMQYSGPRSCESSGIEDAIGFDGLTYLELCTQAVSNKAVYFTRPAPSARVRIFPLYYGNFTSANKPSTYTIPIRNTGELGSDTYDLLSTSSWPVSLYGSDGSTPLTDTDGDGIVDTGLVPQAGSTAVVVKLKTPAAVQVGDDNSATLTATSSLDVTKSKTATLRSAVPTNFAQVFSDEADGAMSFYLVTPEKQTLKKSTGDGYYGYDMTVAEMPGFAYMWSRDYDYPEKNVYTSDIEYTLLDETGQVSRPVSKLTDNSAATMDTYDWDPVTAVTPDGHIGVAWYRYVYNQSSQFNTNMYFAVLNASGNLISRPINLTNNSAWGYSGDDNVPRFFDPRISATGDCRFIIAWNKYHYESGESVYDIYYTVRGRDGGEVRPITKFTSDTPGWDEYYYYPNLAMLRGERVLLTWYRGSDSDIYYAVLNSNGDLVYPATNLTNDGQEWWDWASDATQLSDGKILISWLSEFSVPNPSYQIRFTILDAAYNRISGPTAMANPAAQIGDAYVSVTADLHGNAVLTWMDLGYRYRRNLYYALVNGEGEVLTDPMIFRNAALSEWGENYIESSYLGYGNTTYRSYDLIYDTFLPINER